MTTTIEQSKKFAASPGELYALYMDPKLHAVFTGGAVKISAKPGSVFRAFGGLLTGRMLVAVPGEMVVMRWRSVNFKKGDSDSILILRFVKAGRGGKIEMAHVNVPEQDHGGVQKGWEKYYWGPIREYLKATRKK